MQFLIDIVSKNMTQTMLALLVSVPHYIYFRYSFTINILKLRCAHMACFPSQIICVRVRSLRAR